MHMLKYINKYSVGREKEVGRKSA